MTKRERIYLQRKYYNRTQWKSLLEDIVPAIRDYEVAQIKIRQFRYFKSSLKYKDISELFEIGIATLKNKTP